MAAEAAPVTAATAAAKLTYEVPPPFDRLETLASFQILANTLVASLNSELKSTVASALRKSEGNSGNLDASTAMLSGFINGLGSH